MEAPSSSLHRQLLHPCDNKLTPLNKSMTVNEERGFLFLIPPSGQHVIKIEFNGKWISTQEYVVDNKHRGQ